MASSNTVAVVSCIIAILSFILTVVTIYLTNKHNRLSVKPILKIEPHDFENYIAVFIKNAGTGPLIRQKLLITNGTLNASCLIDLMPKHNTIQWKNFSKFQDYVISSNEQEALIEIKGDKNNDEFNKYKTEIRKALKDITIFCEYSDIYGKTFKSDVVKLDTCYGRHFK